MEELLSPWLTAALAELNRRLPAEQRVFRGEPIPTDGLLAALRERLEEILTLPLAEQLAALTAGTIPASQQLPLKYPALTPLLHQAVFDWAAATFVFCQRLHRDSTRLAHWLGLDRLPPIASLTATASDMHPGAHLVLRILFRNGSCIFYKPRPVTGEWLWHALLESIAATDPTLHLPAAQVLLGANPERYGWMESVLPHPPGPRPQSTPSYWHNAGAMLCLASHVGLTDLHLGNIIATPTGPAVTDAECLGAPILSNHTIDLEKAPARDFDAILQALVATGLLPSQATHGLPDVSGLFGSAAEGSPLHLPQWSRDSQARPVLTTVPAVLLDHGNSPGIPSTLTVLPHLVNGYRHAGEVLLQARNSLLAEKSSWRRLLICSHAPRVVLRDTLTYALLLSRSLDPVHLRSSQQRRYALRDMLHRLAAPRLPASVLRAELHSLLHLHFPRLILQPGTRTLARSSGAPLAHQFARRTPALEVITRISYLSSANLEILHIPALISTLLPRQKPA
jgi:lantibiotic modifying enzyme